MVMRPRLWHVAILLCLCLGTVLAQTLSDPFADGRRVFEEKKYAEALVKFQEALAFVPDDPTILSWIGACHMGLSQFAEAEKAIGQAVEKGGAAYKFYELLMTSQARQGHWDDALATIRRYREVAPEEEEKENDEKLRALQAALHLEKRLVCLRRDPPDQQCAEAELDAAWQLKPKDTAQYVQFAQIWLLKAHAEKDPARKVELYQRSEAAARDWVASAPAADAIRAKATLGRILVRQKKYDEAIGLLEEVRKAAPSDCAVRLDLARCYIGKSDFAQAKAAATEAIGCNPGEAQGYLLRAMADHGLDDCPAVLKDGAEYVKRAQDKEEPRFVRYCKEVVEWQKREQDRQKRLEEYKKWIQRALEEGSESPDE